MWRSGTFPLYSCKAAFWTQETLPRLSDVKRSVVLQSMFAISTAFTYLLFFRECATPPHVQVRHCTWLSFTRPSPALVLQATNAGVRRPGYEATLGYAEVVKQVTEEVWFWHLINFVTKLMESQMFRPGHCILCLRWLCLRCLYWIFVSPSSGGSPELRQISAKLFLSVNVSEPLWRRGYLWHVISNTATVYNGYWHGRHAGVEVYD